MKYRDFDECIKLLNSMIETYKRMYKELGYE